MNFMPMAFEVFGAWSKQTCCLFKHLIRRAASIHGINASVLHNYWTTRITMTLVKYNSKLLINKCASILQTSVPFDDCFNDTMISNYSHVTLDNRVHD